ncbi:MAG TPA: hypothetical protein DCG75_04905 [Bacteroidales bacterium]|nr:hypothetical protein [Bacteroidales bacterium]
MLKQKDYVYKDFVILCEYFVELCGIIKEDCYTESLREDPKFLKVKIYEQNKYILLFGQI